MNALLDEFYALVPEDKLELYQAISDQAIQLGYKPKREKTKHLSISFTSSKYKITILKLVFDRNHKSVRTQRGVRSTAARTSRCWAGLSSIGRIGAERMIARNSSTMSERSSRPAVA